MDVVLAFTQVQGGSTSLDGTARSRMIINHLQRLDVGPVAVLVRTREITSKTRARINALAIPPAYEEVWICPDPNGHLQATGRDARGRKQYRYHPDWRPLRDANKFDRIVAFGQALPKLRRRARADLALPGLPPFSPLICYEVIFPGAVTPAAPAPAPAQASAPAPPRACQPCRSGRTAVVRLLLPGLAPRFPGTRARQVKHLRGIRELDATRTELLVDAQIDRLLDVHVKIVFRSKNVIHHLKLESVLAKGCPMGSIKTRLFVLLDDLLNPGPNLSQLLHWGFVGDSKLEYHPPFEHPLVIANSALEQVRVGED